MSEKATLEGGCGKRDVGMWMSEKGRGEGTVDKRDAGKGVWGKGCGCGREEYDRTLSGLQMAVSTANNCKLTSPCAALCTAVHALR